VLADAAHAGEVTRQRGCTTARISQSDVPGAPVGTIVVVHAAEGGSSGSDLLRLELTGVEGFSPECAVSLLSPSTVTTGGVEIVNGVRP